MARQLDGRDEGWPMVGAIRANASRYGYRLWNINETSYKWWQSMVHGPIVKMTKIEIKLIVIYSLSCGLLRAVCPESAEFVIEILSVNKWFLVRLSKTPKLRCIELVLIFSSTSFASVPIRNFRITVSQIQFWTKGTTKCCRNRTGTAARSQ